MNSRTGETPINLRETWESCDTGPFPSDLVKRRARREIVRRRRVSGIACVFAAVGVTAVAIPALQTESDQVADSGGGDESSLVAKRSVPSHTQVLPDSDFESCAVEYSPATLRGLDFAIDAQVESPPEGGRDATVSIIRTFWGRLSGTVHVALPQPSESEDSTGETYLGSYGGGTRLLLAGVITQNGDVDIWRCGFSRIYDKDSERAWYDAASTPGTAPR